MSKNIKQVFDANPITSNAATDLMYFGQSPYGVGDDAAMTYANFSAQFSTSTLPNNQIFVGNVSNIASPVTMSGDASIINTGALTITNNAVTYAKFQQVAALSVVGRSANSLGNAAAISATVDGQVLRTAGSVLGFGSLDLRLAATVGSSILGIANGGTNSSSQTLNGINYYDGTSLKTNANFTYQTDEVNIGNSAGSMQLYLSKAGLSGNSVGLSFVNIADGTSFSINVEDNDDLSFISNSTSFLRVHADGSFLYPLLAGGGNRALTVNNTGDQSATVYTNLNTASTIVARDGSGNFSAGTITASLTGNVTGSATQIFTNLLSANLTCFPIFVTTTTNSSQIPNLSSGFTFNPSTNTLSTTAINLSGGNLTVTTGNVVIASSGNTLNLSNNDADKILFLNSTNSPKIDHSNNWNFNFRAGSQSIGGDSGIFNWYTSTGASWTNKMTLLNNGDLQLNSGNVIINTVNKGINIKGAAVSAGTANASFVTSVVLVGGTVTVNNSFVTTACCGTIAVVTAGGTPGTGYRLNIGAGSFTVTSSSALDTSTLTVAFFKGI